MIPDKGNETSSLYTVMCIQLKTIYIVTTAGVEQGVPTSYFLFILQEVSKKSDRDLKMSTTYMWQNKLQTKLNIHKTNGKCTYQVFINTTNDFH